MTRMPAETMLSKQRNLKTICAIAPSWLIKRKDFTAGLKKLEELGFRMAGKKFYSKMPSTREKVKQIHQAFADKKVEMILAQRGGYGSMKLLPYLDFALIKKNPKILAGFSDLTTMLNAIYERTGLVTLHSPMVINLSKPSRFTVESFLNALAGFPNKNLFDDAPVKVYNPGTAQGTMKGGNLVTLTALLGTKWEIKTEGAILFFEDVDEKLHEVDRCLTHWLLAGKFKKIKGLVLGDFRGIKSDKVYKILSDQMKINFPVIHCPYIGHVKNKITLPVGAKVELDTRKKSLMLQ
ncbi:MAG: LD-carboxypeptidase [Elusimicrobiota bacterium]